MSDKGQAIQKLPERGGPKSPGGSRETPTAEVTRPEKAGAPSLEATPRLAAHAAARPPDVAAAPTQAAGGEQEPEISVPHDDSLLDCLVMLTGIHGCPMSGEALKAGLPLVDNVLTPALFERAAARAAAATPDGAGAALRVLFRPRLR